MDEKTRLEVLRQSSDALGRRVEQNCIALLDTDNGYEPGTGTLISIGPRLFIATAAHVIPLNPNGRLFATSGKWKNPEKGMLEFLRYRRSKECDVGYLELNPDVACEFLDKEGCSLGSVADLGPGRSAQQSVLVGVSRSLIKVHERHGWRLLDVGVVGYSSNVAGVDELDELDPHPPFEPSSDVILDYRFEDCRRFDTWEKIAPPQPNGMSGGGIWDMGFDRTIMWDTGKARLFGIQHSYDPKRGYIRATQIIHWVRLLYEDYDELRELLRGQFPGLACVSGSLDRRGA